ncbi:O-antigen ligase family protein [Erythrobacter sp. SDW2]|uniref:O-antigen ligase family protein n=1 Tax=Erythrobacter sp. SDW2 TaxID=2907154 RepID=UPI001F3C0F39|nr:O-antigen ligase family protein [Erythrobacter sp. SDW2]UIP07365.1 O-antigen ligase family protein [Erythrobacter sp. SDW2]
MPTMTAQPKTRLSRFYSPTARFAALASFVVLLFVLGGSSRHDVPSLVILRPLAALFLAYAAAGMTREQWRLVRVPILLLAALALVIWLQLVPLPPSLWSGLPGRQPIAEMGQALGMDGLWRPLSMSPAKTWNALFSLLVPAAALALFAIQEPEGRRQVWSVVLVMALVSAALGVLQITTGAFYFHAFSPSGYATGLFANRNHQGVLLAAMLLVAAWQFGAIRPRQSGAGMKGLLALAPLVFLVPVIFLAGSRAGLICAGLGLLLAMGLIAQAPLVPQNFALGKQVRLSRTALLGGLGLFLAALVGIVILSSRALALDRLFDDGALENLRVQVFPTLTEMAGDMVVWGSGFGSFEYVYRIYEPVALLGPKYLNNAHNDWLQFVIEGGLPAVVILLGSVLAMGVKTFAAWRAEAGELRRRRLMAAGIMLLLAVASLVDYPVRVPSVMVVAALAFATLWIEREPLSSGQPEGREGRRNR